ncbi:hypothetical protein T440DRAFT_273688 [Plenodomus tracheiphilus IPT5]|uniref:Uncharacterized protein n=1 Tax=Plenodomus tracheiphilus IPT5 TaxID=1408161 RepID=A0A6A7BI16_9PLEO|nr:hypothetical protein T440DRAFT_273688 [Plenodomus tracheiphilus IPT5]
MHRYSSGTRFSSAIALRSSTRLCQLPPKRYPGVLVLRCCRVAILVPQSCNAKIFSEYFVPVIPMTILYKTTGIASHIPFFFHILYSYLLPDKSSNSYIFQAHTTQLLNMPSHSCMLPFLRTIYPPHAFPKPPPVLQAHQTDGNLRCVMEACCPVTAFLTPNEQNWHFIPVLYSRDFRTCWVLFKGNWTQRLSNVFPCPQIDTIPVCEFCWAELQMKLPERVRDWVHSDLGTLELEEATRPREERKAMSMDSS